MIGDHDVAPIVMVTNEIGLLKRKLEAEFKMYTSRRIADILEGE